MVSEVGHHFMDIVSWCQKCVTNPQTTDIISWCQKSGKIWIFISFEEELILGFHSGFCCVILDLKDLPSHLFHQRIVTFNNWQSYCLDSSWTLTFGEVLIVSFSFHVISQQLDLFSSFSSLRGEIHGNSWTSSKFGKFAEFFMETLVQGTQATQAKDTQVMLTQTKRQRKFELFNPSQA